MAVNPKFFRDKPTNKQIINTIGKMRYDDILYEGFVAWSSLDGFRKMASRNEMYTFGNQWGDQVIDPKTGNSVTEEVYIKSQGNMPLKNNLIRGTVRAVTGIFSSTQTEPVVIARDRDKQGRGEMMTNTLQANYQLNKTWGLDRLNFQYFLISGLAIAKETFALRGGVRDVWDDIPNIHSVFFDNHMVDPRHTDCHLIGELHDMSIYDVMGMFSAGDKKRAQEIKEYYRYTSEQTINHVESITKDVVKNNNFYIPKDETRCRVIEIWRKESKERISVHDRLNGELYKVEVSEGKSLEVENQRRVEEQTRMGIEPENMKLLEYEWFIDSFWYYYFLSPMADVLLEGETPYWHEEHPYAFRIYPFYNGRVYPFVGDYIDQQRYINRIIMMQDLVSKTSAKGVLMFPESAKPDDMSMDEISDAWAAYDGIIYYKPTPGVARPEQVIVNSSNTGLYDMLNVQLKMFQEVSGVQGALQGQAPTSGTPAALYIQQTQNAQTSLVDVFESFKEFREVRDVKKMKLIQQYYDDEKFINVNGASKKSFIYRPQDIRDAELDLSIEESQNTPVYRMIMNDFLMQLKQNQEITLDELLQVGAFPFADELRQVIKNRENNGEIPPQMQEQINIGMQQEAQENQQYNQIAL